MHGGSDEGLSFSLKINLVSVALIAVVLLDTIQWVIRILAM